MSRARIVEAKELGHTYCPERRVCLHGVSQVVLQSYQKKINPQPHVTISGNRSNCKGRMRRSTDVEVWRVAADADLYVPRLDGAAEELRGYALGELDVHVHLLQRLVPLKHLLPCSWPEWRGGMGDQTLGRRAEGGPGKGRRAMEGCEGGGEAAHRCARRRGASRGPASPP